MSSKLEPAIWSSDTGQRMPKFDKCQLSLRAKVVLVLMTVY